MSHDSTWRDAPGVRRLISTQTAGERIGVSMATVQQWVRDGRLPAVRIGRRYRIDADELDKLIAGGAL